MKLLDTVALLEDLPELNLYRGQVGTSVKTQCAGIIYLILLYCYMVMFIKKRS